MRKSSFFASLLTLSAAGIALLRAHPAAACGGCFAPPTDNTIVSDHRMVLSISTKETSLYDQIRYSGNPSSFAWVLPIRGLAKVGVSADRVFQLLDQNTATSVLPPPRNCPLPPVCPSPKSGVDAGAVSYDASSARGPQSADAGGSGVTVVKEETVGPYETVQLAASDPNALDTWLTTHGYAIPADVKPMLAGYVDEGFGFLALKLVPGGGVQSMKPIRVTTEGASTTLPLRMVAAGSGVDVGLTLWVVADGRWSPRSFPSFSITADQLEWTWATNTHNFKALRNAEVARLGGAAWEIESSILFGTSVVTSGIDAIVNSPMPPQVQLPDGGFGPFQLYDAVPGVDGGVGETSAQAASEDMAALFQHHTTRQVTRMRSDLPRASLATDLELEAAADQSALPNFRQIVRETDEPMCPAYDGCKYDGLLPRSQARAKAIDSCRGTTDGSAFCPQSSDQASAGSGASSGSDCSIHTISDDGAAPIGIGAMFALSVLARFSKRRRDRG